MFALPQGQNNPAGFPVAIAQNAFTVLPSGNEFWAMSIDRDPQNAITGLSRQADPLKLAEYVARESGVAANMLYTEGALRMLADPAGSYQQYRIEVAQKVAAASQNYLGDINDLAAAGIPEEAQKKIALNKARAFLDGELSLLNLKYPLAGNRDMLATASVKGGMPIHVPNPFGGPTQSDVDYKAKYERHKAKKAARKTKKGGQ